MSSHCVDGILPFLLPSKLSANTPQLRLADLLWVLRNQGLRFDYYGRDPMAPRPSLQHSVETHSFFFSETYSGLLMRTCGVRSAFCVLTRLAGDLRFVVVWELSWMRAKHQQRKVHWNFWIPKSHECLLNMTSRVQRTSICQRCKDKNSTAACSMPEKPPGPPSFLWSHGHSSAMPADDKIFGSGFLLNPMGTADH